MVNELHATSSGEVLVTGTVVAKWWSDGKYNPAHHPDIDLLPDEKSKALLPHYQRYRVHRIELLNGPEALRLAAGKKVADRFAQRKVMLVRVRGAFVVNSYEVGVECGAPWAKANFVQVKSSQVPHVASKGFMSGC